MITASDFNLWISRFYWFKAVDIAGRFIDRNVGDHWARLACEWHAAYEFGAKAPEGDVYFEQGRFERRHSVDALCQDNPATEKGKILTAAWVAYATDLEKRRAAMPRPVEPPQPVELPKPKPKPVEPPKPAEPVEPEPVEPPTSKKPSIFGDIIKAVIEVVLSFVPGIFGTVARMILGLFFKGKK